MTSFSFISFAIIAASAQESPSIPQTAFHYDVSLSPIVLLTALILGVVSTTAWGLRRTRKAHIQWPLSLRLIRECAGCWYRLEFWGRLRYWDRLRTS